MFNQIVRLNLNNMKHLLSIILLLIPILTFSQGFETPESFRHLKKVIINEERSIFAFFPQNYDPEANKIKISKILDDFYKNEDEMIMPLAFVSIDLASKTEILIGYSEGASEDPEFWFYKKGETGFRSLKSIYGKQIFISGNGNIYVSGHTNNMFNKRRKFKYENSTIREIEQPFYFVGLQTKTLKTIKIHSDKSLTKILATLPADSPIEIVAAEYANECQYFLIKTSFGLLGWWKLDNFNSREIDKLFYAGD